MLSQAEPRLFKKHNVENTRGSRYTDCLNAMIKQNGNHLMKTRSISKAIEEVGFVKVDKSVKWRGRTRRLYVRKASELVLHGDDQAVLREALDATVDDDFDTFTSSSVVHLDDFK